MPPWNAAKTKVQLRIAVQRLRTLQIKKGAQAKTSRRDIATLIEIRKLEKARVKVEAIINDDIHIELLELLELYCELLIARFGLLEMNTPTPDPGISEGVCSIIYAAPRTELKELHVLRDLLMHKFGRDFSVAAMENRDNCVSERVIKKVTFVTPEPVLVDAYLAEIARGYGLSWAAPESNDSSSAGDSEGGSKDVVSSVDLEPLKHIDEKFPDPKEPKLPDLPPTEDEDVSSSLGKLESAKPPVGGPLPPTAESAFELLQKRFNDLKKR